jgi:hypothetical protein
VLGLNDSNESPDTVTVYVLIVDENITEQFAVIVPVVYVDPDQAPAAQVPPTADSA